MQNMPLNHYGRHQRNRQYNPANNHNRSRYLPVDNHGDVTNIEDINEPLHSQQTQTIPELETADGLWPGFDAPFSQATRNAILENFNDDLPW